MSQASQEEFDLMRDAVLEEYLTAKPRRCSSQRKRKRDGRNEFEKAEEAVESKMG